MSGPYRVLVTGSRDWGDADMLSFELGVALREALREGHSLADVVIVHGDCPAGVDHMADRLASDFGYAVERHPADWDQYGKSAGPRRNAEMVALGANVCVAFIGPCTKPGCRTPGPHGSHGATHCADLAEKSGIPVRRYERIEPARPGWH
jgi:YspA, cpYpsA-related SLOG family